MRLHLHPPQCSLEVLVQCCVCSTSFPLGQPANSKTLNEFLAWKIEPFARSNYLEKTLTANRLGCLQIGILENFAHRRWTFDARHMKCNVRIGTVRWNWNRTIPSTPDFLCRFFETIWLVCFVEKRFTADHKCQYRFITWPMRLPIGVFLLYRGENAIAIGGTVNV